jgi:hypothetical protein
MENMPKPAPAVARDRVLGDAELAAVWKAADRIGWPFGPIVKLLILTGARKNEIAALRWSEIKNDRIELPAERVKNGEAKTIPLSPAAAAILEAVPRIVDSAFVFTSKGSKPMGVGWRTKERLDRAADEIMGEPLGDWRVHDIRRSVATGLQRLDARLEVIEAVLGHTSGSQAGIVGVYQRHSFTDEKRAALEAWAHRVAVLFSGATEPVSPSGGSMTKRMTKSPKGLLTNETLAWGDPRNPFRETVEVIEDAEGGPKQRIKIMGPDPQEAIKGYIGLWRKWACTIIKDEGGDPARYHEILSERKNPKPSDEDGDLRTVPVPATGRDKLKRDGGGEGRCTIDAGEPEIPAELDSKRVAAELLRHLDKVEKYLRRIVGQQNGTVWGAIYQALLTATYAHQLTVVENEEAIDFGVNRRPEGAKKGGKARAEQVKEANRKRDKEIFKDYLEAEASHIRTRSKRSASKIAEDVGKKYRLTRRAASAAIKRGQALSKRTPAM